MIDPVIYRYRGVTYAALPQPDGTVVLTADGVVCGTGRFALRIDSSALLGGDEASAKIIYEGLESGFGESLSISASAASGGES